MHYKINTVCVILGLLVLNLSLLNGQTPTKTIKGIYGSPHAFWEKGYHLRDLGINAIFVHSGSLTPEMVEKAKSEKASVFAEFATLNGKNYVEKHPEAWAVNERGEKVEAASWFMGVCPTEPGFREYRMNQLRQLLTEYELDGVWMDYVHWHAQFEDPEPILPETCFNASCITAFSKDTGTQIPDGTTTEKATFILENKQEQWRDWRCKVIYDWTKAVKQIVKQIRPKALLGLYHCPWVDGEFDDARNRILGLDYSLLQNSIDVFSPMVYHERMGRSPNWVSQNVSWLGKKLKIKKKSYPKIWPIVQAHNSPGIVTTSEFETVLKGGLASGSSGIMMFTSNAVAEDEAKTEIMKRFYISLDSIRSSD